VVLLPRQLMEALAQLPCDGPGLARTDQPAITLDNGHDLRRGAAQKALIRSEHVVACQRHLPYWNIGRAGKIQDRATGDAFEDAGVRRRRADLAFLDD